MKIKTRCSHCGKMYQTEAEHIGKTAQCKQCQNNFVMAAFDEKTIHAPQPVAAPPGAFAEAGVMPSPPDLSDNIPEQPIAAPSLSNPDLGQVNTQTVVCPKCKFTADIPRVSGKMLLRCQECGHKFTVKPEPRKKGAAGPGSSAKKEFPKPVLILIVIAILLAAVVFVGPTLLPDIIPNLLP